MRGRRFPFAVLLLALYLGLLPSTAFAYVDPGSGSFMVQSILATLAGASIFLRGWRLKLTQMLRWPWKRPNAPHGRH